MYIEYKTTTSKLSVHRQVIGRKCESSGFPLVESLSHFPPICFEFLFIKTRPAAAADDDDGNDDDNDNDDNDNCNDNEN